MDIIMEVKLPKSDYPEEDRVTDWLDKSKYRTALLAVNERLGK